ncbi:hypothetical protein LOTGIDRAFT_143329, partial [Lottia gigantea]
CMQSAEVGPCRALMPKYYYNATMKRCMKFMFGGCHENENNFPDLETCAKTCGWYFPRLYLRCRNP